jgi:SAM-dependent methyltransferase
MDIPFPENTFDKIVLSEVLEHLPDDLGALREVKRVLKPGGVIAITVPHQDYPLLWDPINWSRERFNLPPIRSWFFGGLWTNRERLYTRTGILGLVQQAGLCAEDVRQLVHYCFPFAHNLVYGLGKWLVESGLMRSADRFYYDKNTGSLLNPLNLGRWIFNRIDELNDPVSDEGKTTVILSVKARKL